MQTRRRGIITSRKNKSEEENNNSENIEENDEEEEHLEYQNEESFMNSIHPFEKNKKNSEAKTSPIQRAIIECIRINNGSATENQILQYVTSKWEIINKYSERSFKMEPTMRVIRLNCSVKKKSRHLFYKDPERNDSWIINEKKKKDRTEDEKKDLVSDDNTDNNYDLLNKDDTPEISSQSNDLFEELIFQYLESKRVPITNDELIQYASTISNKPGLFNQLPLFRRLRACLIVLKHSGRIFFHPLTSSWSTIPFQEIEINSFISFDLPKKLGIRIKDVTSFELFDILKKNNIY